MPGPCLPVALPISVLIGNRLRAVNQLRNRKCSNVCVRLSNLAVIPCQPQLVTTFFTDSVFNKLKLALLNVRSLAGKTFLINDFITEHNLDFMFLTETWIEQNNSAAVLIESTPPNFSFMSQERMHKKGGGVAILFNDSIQCRKTSYGDFASFEYVALQLKCSSSSVPKYLSIVCIDFDRLVVVGDFNIHVDNPQDRGAKELFCVLDNYGLTQHVAEPTHNKGEHSGLNYLKGSEYLKGCGD